MFQPPSPWSRVVRRQAGKEGNVGPQLIVGPIGSLPLEYAREIHRNTGGGTLERIICTPNSTVLRMQLFGPLGEVDSEFAFLEKESPNNGITRATGGTLLFDSVDRCNPSDVGWIVSLLTRKAVHVDGGTFQLDPSTRILATITHTWIDTTEYVVPQWLDALFCGRTMTIEPLRDHPSEIIEAIQWFSWEAAAEGQSVGTRWTDEAKDLLLKRQWPGGYEELRNVVRSLVEVSVGGEITFEICKRVLHRHESPGMSPIDLHRRQECYNYSRGLLYVGRSVTADEVYAWIEQLSKVSLDQRFDPWLTGLRIVREISTRYYYSVDKLRMLLREAYLALSAELVDHGFMPNLSLVSDGSPPTPRVLLANPLGPVKSAAAILPHAAHLLGAGRSQQVVPLKGLAARLDRDEYIQVILFCDDFTGTGEQIVRQLVEVLSRDEALQAVCVRRFNRGRPVALGIALGVGFAEAIRKICTSGPEWLPIFAHAGEVLDDGDRAFSSKSLAFPEPELRNWSRDLVVNQIGGTLSSQWPGGFGNLQALVVTADNVPNDSLPAIWKSGLVQGVTWKALFERASSPSG